MAELWHPDAIRDRLDDAGGFLKGPFRGVIHTTQGGSYAGAKGSYVRNRSAPHFTIGLQGLWQHIPLDRAARALQNPPGGVHTNLQSAIQVEVIHLAENPWPDQLVEALRELMIWVEDQTGIKPWAPGQFPGPDGYGVRTPWRMQAESWLRFDGWCGHSMVPENLHWDPGALIPIAKLLAREENPVADPAAPPVYKVNARVVTMVATPTGKGYWVLTADGGVFSFGDAPYLGRLEAPTT